MIDPKIFRAYDIRGIYPADLDEKTAHTLGRAFVDYVFSPLLSKEGEPTPKMLRSFRGTPGGGGSAKVVVGCDVRLSGPSLKKALLRGITEQGASVVDIGLVASDMFYFACGHFGQPGIMVTASHNPKEYNGFKLVKKMPNMIPGEEIRDFVLAGNFQESSGQGSVVEKNIKEEYRKKVLSLFDLSVFPNFKIVVDAANGMGGVAIDLLYKDLPIAIERMYFAPDGTFPNHGGDPLLPENRQELEARVVESGADLGMATDPDADRFFAVDHTGQFVPGDFLTALFGKYLIEKSGHGRVVYDLKCSWAVRDLAAAAGGEAVEAKTGTRYIKEKMVETKALFAGEVSGHFYFPELFGADSGAAASLLLLEMLGCYKKSLAELTAPLWEKYFLSGEINSTVADKETVLKNIKNHFRSEKIYELDGISIVGEDWHANIRKSNTEPLLRMNVEGLSQARMAEKRDEIMALIK